MPHRPPPVIVAIDIGGVAVLKHGRRFLLSDDLGDIHPDTRGLGLYEGDTRVVARLELRLDGRRPLLLRADPGGAAEGIIQLAHPPLADDPTAPVGMAVGLDRSMAVTRRRRLVAGLDEEIELLNPGAETRRVEVGLILDSDMADLFEIRGHPRSRRGEHLPIELADDRATFTYDGLDGRRWRAIVTTPGGRLEPAAAGEVGAVTVSWSAEVPAGGTTALGWSIAVEVAEAAPADGSPTTDLPAMTGRRASSGPLSRAAVAAGDRSSAPPPFSDAARIRTDDARLDRVLERSVADLALLTTPGPGPGERFLAAGIPWFMTLFGRDAIIASHAAMAVDPGPAVDTLRVMARLQATADDPARDAEPGKMIHEIRDGEMARLGEVPFGRYHGAADSTPLWLVLLGETFDWTGDLGLVRELWPTALAALEWLERAGDLDGDGFVEYRRRAPGGLVNQGWKDAVGAIRDRHGGLAEEPIALVEVQAYAYDARRRMAHLAGILGEAELAERLRSDAARLRQRFEDTFWVPDPGWYALALDRAKRPMDALGSNQGHALWSGIVDPARATSVARWLGHERMDSGWGLRTLGADEPGYSPLGYHTGSVWPHDTAIAVAGLRRYDQDAVAARLADGLLDAGRELADGRMPELFCGFPRDGSGRPVPYPVACAPQAWAAAAPILVLASLLGLRPRAGEGRLDIERPRLPSGVGRLVVERLRIGDARVDLEFRREGPTTVVRTLATSGRLEVAVRA